MYYLVKAGETEKRLQLSDKGRSLDHLVAWRLSLFDHLARGAYDNFKVKSVAGWNKQYEVSHFPQLVSIRRQSLSGL